jgi:hypothetical protein
MNVVEFTEKQVKFLEDLVSGEVEVARATQDVEMLSMLRDLQLAFQCRREGVADIKPSEGKKLKIGLDGAITLTCYGMHVEEE